MDKGGKSSDDGKKDLPFLLNSESSNKKELKSFKDFKKKASPKKSSAKKSVGDFSKFKDSKKRQHEEAHKYWDKKDEEAEKRSKAQDRKDEKLKKIEEKEQEKILSFDEPDKIVRLNKYISTSGICSRRKAAELVKEGLVKVNGKIEINPAYVVSSEDVVEYDGKTVIRKETKVYFLMNKPKNFITTSSDEKGRKTVMDLMKGKTSERVFPVGRLDRNTTGLLLITNDGDLATKLTHPRYSVKKFYHATLDKILEEKDFEDIKKGLTLEDGDVSVDSLKFINGSPENEVMMEIHIGRNRIVRRIFEHLGYNVEKLDRTYFAGLTKKDLPRGFSRPLTNQEIIMLKHFTNQKSKV